MTDPDIAAVRDALDAICEDSLEIRLETLLRAGVVEETPADHFIRLAAALARVEARLEALERASRELIASVQGVLGEFDGADERLDQFVALLPERTRRHGGATFYDREIHVAFVNIQTARALKDRGLLTFSHFDPEWGTSLTLTEAGWHD